MALSEAGLRQLNPDLAFIRELKAAGGDNLKKCFQCATCSVVCNLASKDKPFPRREMVYAQWGLKESLLSDANIWLCHQCNDCSVKCPRQARPGDVLAALRAFSFRHFAFPAYMGQALAHPSALITLFLVPMLLLLGVALISTGTDLSFLFQTHGEVDYARAFRHGLLEMLFMGGNALIFAFAAVGLVRFWNGLKASAPGQDPKFLPSFLATVLEIGLHRKFSKCDANKMRQWGHLLIFYGFLGAMATAGLALFFTVILQTLGSTFYLVSPIDWPNPIKIIGVVSGVALLIGAGIQINGRLKQNEVVGASRYQDWLFLTIITLVALTGMGAWLLRLAEIPIVAYADYYLHLVLVYFLLWYAPYSKFAHMFYRTLALTFAKGVGWDRPRALN